jgi:hypothetical protein
LPALPDYCPSCYTGEFEKQGSDAEVMEHTRDKNQSNSESGPRETKPKSRPRLLASIVVVLLAFVACTVTWLLFAPNGPLNSNVNSTQYIGNLMYINEVPSYPATIIGESRDPGQQPTPAPGTQANYLSTVGVTMRPVQSLQYSVGVSASAVMDFYDKWLTANGFQPGQNTGPGWYTRTDTSNFTTTRFNLDYIRQGMSPLQVDKWHIEVRYILSVAAGKENRAHPPFRPMTRVGIMLKSQTLVRP